MRAAGINTKISGHPFRATGIAAYIENGGTPEYAPQTCPLAPSAGC